jgi:heat shock protein HslJ/membrane-bound inhibitor of C-type lysozyme
LAVLAAVLTASAAGAADSVVSVTLVGGTYVMEYVQSDTGERYESADDPGTFFMIEGDAAALSIEGAAYTKYVLLRDAGKDEIIVTADGRNYRMKRVVTASGAKYEADGPDTFFWSKGEGAVLRLNGEEYEGYSRWLPSGEIWLADQYARFIPTETELRAVSINGRDVTAGSAVTLTFHRNGSLSGTASVNNYASSWISAGSRLLISSGISTRKAGPPDLMEQERAFLETLSGVTRFKVGRDHMILETKDGGKIVFTR